MLSSTKRKILYIISLVLAIGCLSTGLAMRYGTQEEVKPILTDIQPIILPVADSVYTDDPFLEIVQPQ